MSKAIDENEQQQPALFSYDKQSATAANVATFPLPFFKSFITVTCKSSEIDSGRRNRQGVLFDGLIWRFRTARFALIKNVVAYRIRL